MARGNPFVIGVVGNFSGTRTAASRDEHGGRAAFHVAFISMLSLPIVGFFYAFMIGGAAGYLFSAVYNRLSR